MNPEGKGILARLDASDEEIARAWGHAISAALLDHRRADVPVATWDDERLGVVLISADEVIHEQNEPGVIFDKTAG